MDETGKNVVIEMDIEKKKRIKLSEIVITIHIVSLPIHLFLYHSISITSCPSSLLPYSDKKEASDKSPKSEKVMFLDWT